MSEHAVEAQPGHGWCRDVLERVVAGIVVVQDDRLVYANPQALAMLERTPGTLGEVDIAAWLGPLQHAHQLARTASVLSGEQERIEDEYRVRLPTGRVIHLEVVSTLAAWEGAPAVLSVLRDISAQAEAAAALRSSEERYRSMVESLDEGVLIFDATGAVTGANRAAQELLGQDLATLRNHMVPDWRPLDLNMNEMAPRDIPIAVTLATGQPMRHVPLGMRRPGGGVAWLDVNAEPVRDRDTGRLTGAVLSFTDTTDQRRVQHALRASEDTNRALMDSLADGVFVAQDHRFVYANGTLPKLLGYERADFIGLPFASVVAPENLALWSDRFEGRVGPGTEPVRTYEVRFLRRDGSAIEFELVANRTEFQGRAAVLGVLRDITERKKHAAELENYRGRLEELVQERTRALEVAVASRVEAEDFAQTMTDHQPTLLAYIDREMRVQFANRAYLTWFGRTRDELIGQDARDALGEDVMLQPARDVIDRVLRGEAMGTPNDMRGADGRIGHFWIYRMPDVRDGEIRGYFFIATDITELRRSERRLKELNTALIRAESFTRGIADNLPGRVAYWDSEQRCRFANRVYCEWFGKSLDQVLGKTTTEIFGEDRAPERAAYAVAALTGEPQQFESHEVSAEGRSGIWQVHYIPDIIRGDVRGFYVLASDITASKRAQADLQSLNEELVVARDRAEDAANAKSAFLANMSHEIRTPMNVIIGLTHLMQRDPHDPVTGDRLGKVSDAAQHLLDIINDILDLSKIDAGKLALAPIDFAVDALLTRSSSMVADGARRKGLALSVDRGDLPPALRGDALRLSQVLVNLLSNAVKFTTRGSVALRCGVVDHQGDAWMIRFAVHDTGVGIQPGALDRLFTPFEQADGSTTRRFGGTGLGLSIARELAHLMGGTIGVESEPGRGSVFWFTARLQGVLSLDGPVSALDAAVAPGEASEYALRRRHAGARVLLADDNRINQELATELLKLVDLRVDVADNGRIASEMAETGRYDLILMDMQMPEMDGLEATRRIRNRPPLDHTPIVAMTASAFGADRDACLEAGMNDHIGKPVNPVTLYDTLLRWLDAAARQSAGIGPAGTPSGFGALPSAESAPTRPPPVAAPPPAPAARPPGGGAAADILGAIDGLDLSRGLGLFAGQRSLYVQALGYFIDLYGEGLKAVDQYLEGAPGATREAAGREVHSMGGAAAALGAIELEVLAQHVDHLIRHDRDRMPDEQTLRAELEALREILQTLVRQLREALKSVPPPPPRRAAPR